MHTNVNASVALPKTLQNIVDLEDSTARSIMDKSVNIDRKFVDKVINRSVFSWEGRNPRPALDDDGNFQCTNLDLLSFLVPMVARGAVIEIPRYQNRRKIVRKANERKVGSSQFGKTTGLTSNKDVFSFSVRIFDQSIVVKNPETEEETMCGHRNYMLVDCDGHWYDGWNCITWDPSKAENAFLNDKNLWTGNSVIFKDYVHENRKQSVYGSPYILLKMLSKRLSDEAKFYAGEVDRLKAKGFSLPPGEKGPYVKPFSEGATESIKVGTMEMVLDTPEFTGKYKRVRNTQKGLLTAYRRRKELIYTLKPLVQFVLRADEAAFYLHGQSEMFVPAWMNGAEWSKGFKLPKGRVTWNLMDFGNGFALRYRTKEVSQKVSAE